MYGKIFESVFEGSMVGQPTDVFAVWSYVIARAQANHIVELNPKLLSFIFGGVTEERIREIIEYFCSPDPESRNQDEEGRKLVKAGSFAYLVVSHKHYCGIRDMDAKRSADAQRAKRYRDKRRDALRTVTRDVTHRHAPSHEVAHVPVPVPVTKDLSSNADASVASLKPQKSFDLYLQAWNEHCGSLSKISSLSDKRRAKLKTRIAEGLNLEKFIELVKSCAKTPFLRGENDRNWKADFDWLIENQDNGLKILENKYGKSELDSKPKYRDPATIYEGPEYQPDYQPRRPS